MSPSKSIIAAQSTIEESSKTVTGATKQDLSHSTFYTPQPAPIGSFVSYSKTSSEQAVEKDAPILFQPMQLRGLTLPNRVIVAPMCTYSAKNGVVTDFHLVHLGAMALHGPGLIIAEATAVEARGRITPADAGFWSDAHIAPWKRVVDFVHAQGGRIGVQLAHAGRKASAAGQYTHHEPDEYWPDNVIAPTGGLQWDDKHMVPREVSLDEIQEVIKAFGAAARRADAAGMDAIEIHAAHGYLIHSFLSRFTNKRTDRYGGSLENRARLLLEVIAEMRANFPAHKPILVRVSASDRIEYLDTDEAKEAWDVEQTVQLAHWIQATGAVDVLHVSSGGTTPLQKINNFPGYQVPFAERVKRDVPELKVAAVGLIGDGKQANDILAQGQADLVAVGRPFLRHPSFVEMAAMDLNVRPKFAAQYEVARPGFYRKEA